jgi:hypothetical protein
MATKAKEWPTHSSPLKKNYFKTGDGYLSLNQLARNFEYLAGV